MGVEYGMRIGDKDIIKEHFEGLDLYDNAYLNFRLHIGEGQQVNDYVLHFIRKPDETHNYEKGILCKDNDLVNNKDLKGERKLLSNIIYNYPEGTYLILAYRSVNETLSKTQSEAARALSNNMFKINKPFIYFTKCFVKSCQNRSNIDTSLDLQKCQRCNYYYCVKHSIKHKCRYKCDMSGCETNNKGYKCSKCKKIYCKTHFFKSFRNL